MDMKKWVKDAETHKKKDREEKDALKAEIEKLKEENTNLKQQLNDIEVSRDVSKISSIEDIKEEVKNNIELAKTGWVDVVKRNIKKEIKDENIVNTTLEEKKMCHNRHLNERVTGLKEGASPDKDAQTLGKMLG